ncbi:hypothetical protein PspLS_11715 [Pyricularia sp. CBS 133598]|nr:hypothetical protein PspLS_11715 [Pyricularia sp. CBS 133598]
MKQTIKVHFRSTALHRWHTFLSLPRQASVSWHCVRLREELTERLPAGVLLYMVAKLSLRWTFYHIVASTCGARGRKLKDVREVVNPRKTSKVDEVAGRHGLDPRICRSWAKRVK